MFAGKVKRLKSNNQGGRAKMGTAGPNGVIPTVQRRANIVCGLASKITISSIACTLSLAEIYERVVFPEPKEEPNGELQP